MKEEDFYKDAILDRLERPVPKWNKFRLWVMGRIYNFIVDFIKGLTGRE